jgi:hypothetical protein
MLINWLDLIAFLEQNIIFSLSLLFPIRWDKTVLMSQNEF